MKKLFPCFLSFMAAFALAAAFIISCSSDLSFPLSPDKKFPEPGGSSSGSSSSAGDVFCRTGETCMEVPAQVCSALSGTEVPNCSKFIFCQVNDEVCFSLPEEMCSAAKGTEVLSCGTGGSSSSANGLEDNVFCKIGDTCNLIPKSYCSILGTEVPNCGTGGNSSSSGNGSSSSSFFESKEPSQFDGNEFTDPRDDRKYMYEVASNGSVWMSENLDYSRFGTLGYCYKSGAQANDLGSAGENLPGCNTPYGRFYTYAVATDGKPSVDKAQGLCPNGWHIPNAAEWKTRAVTGIPNPSAGNYDVLFSVWQNRSQGGFYWYSNAVINSSDLGFTFIWGYPGNMYSFQVREVDELAKSNDYFSVRCTMDTDFVPTCGGEPFDPVTEKCVSGDIVAR